MVPKNMHTQIQHKPKTCTQTKQIQHMSLMNSCRFAKSLMVTYSADGTKQINGGAGLKESQTYPVLFGYAVAKVYIDWRPQLTREWMRTHLCNVDDITLAELMGAGTLVDTWEDADLHPVMDLLMASVASSDGAASSNGAESH